MAAGEGGSRLLFPAGLQPGLKAGRAEATAHAGLIARITGSRQGMMVGQLHAPAGRIAAVRQATLELQSAVRTLTHYHSSFSLQESKKTLGQNRESGEGRGNFQEKNSASL